MRLNVTGANTRQLCKGTINDFHWLIMLLVYLRHHPHWFIEHTMKRMKRIKNFHSWGYCGCVVPQICPAKRVLAICHVCAILVANTTENCAGGLIIAALRVRAGCCEAVSAVHAATQETQFMKCGRW